MLSCHEKCYRECYYDPDTQKIAGVKQRLVIDKNTRQYGSSASQEKRLTTVQRGPLPRLPAGAITHSRMIRLTRIRTLRDAWYEIKRPRNNLARLPRKDYEYANSRLDKMPSNAKALMSTAQREKSQKIEKQI